LGGQYTYISPAFGKVFLRAGYKALFMEDSQYGASFGFGFETHTLFNTGIKMEYALRDMGILGYSPTYTLGILF